MGRVTGVGDDLAARLALGAVLSIYILVCQLLGVSYSVLSSHIKVLHPYCRCKAARMADLADPFSLQAGNSVYALLHKPNPS